MKKTIGILALVACAGIASASISTPGTSIGTASFTNVGGDAGIGNAGNSLGSWVATGSGIVGSIEVTGTLVEEISGTYVSEARVNIINSANASGGVVRASTQTTYSSPLAVGPVTVGYFSGGPLNVTAGDTVNFEWFESYDDGAGVDSTWDSVTYNFMTAATITNGNFAAGSLTPGSSYATTGSHVSGGLDFFTFSISDNVEGGGYLNIAMLAGASGSMTDTEIALYDGMGNLVDFDDDGQIGNYSMLSYGSADPFTSGSTDASGADGLFLAAGTYTLVTGGYNTIFGATIGAITPGTNTGTYSLAINYVPTPGALALLGMGGLIANRRRR